VVTRKTCTASTPSPAQCSAIYEGISKNQGELPIQRKGVYIFGHGDMGNAACCGHPLGDQMPHIPLHVVDLSFGARRDCIRLRNNCALGFLKNVIRPAMHGKNQKRQGLSITVTLPLLKIE